MPGSNDPTLDMYNSMCMKEVMDSLNKKLAATQEVHEFQMDWRDNRCLICGNESWNRLHL